ncbi:TraB/GumN family protein [Phenylobacterium hankyongense]|uniref:TraB/GumN family protein n=1 Tax=Phenylobacterium hankyongense TaxID=1813876 RepID=A0A328AYY4_9CAUL|nr:TraB/GumN family protein [Phenylobacterium hankyongense]RAK58886.1 TraB/GumN family protein [Phenylobacterium hankyongense]
MSWFRRIAIGGFAVLLWGLGLAGAADAAPALWVVKGANSEIYLFGTLHALEPGAQWRTPAYDAAYARATTVWFEADLQGGDPQTVGRILARYGVDPTRRLSEKLPPDQVQALGRQVDLARIDHLRPWAAAMMLSMQPMLSRGASVEAGADLTMTRAARGAAKTVRTFETLEDQARLFAGLSEPVELRYLSDVIRERGAPRRLTLHPGEGSLEQAWLAGDMGRLGPRLIGDMRAENPDFYEALLKRRNLAWADALTRELADPGVELVNVGALHMVGPDGLPALMAARGFTVERVQ